MDLIRDQVVTSIAKKIRNIQVKTRNLRAKELKRVERQGLLMEERVYTPTRLTYIELFNKIKDQNLFRELTPM